MNSCGCLKDFAWFWGFHPCTFMNILSGSVTLFSTVYFISLIFKLLFGVLFCLKKEDISLNMSGSLWEIFMQTKCSDTLLLRWVGKFLIVVKSFCMCACLIHMHSASIESSLNSFRKSVRVKYLITERYHCMWAFMALEHICFKNL